MAGYGIHLPSFVKNQAGGAEVGTGAIDGNYAHGLSSWVLNAMTPETNTKTHSFWTSVRAFAIHDPAAYTLLMAQVGEAFKEDKTVLEAQPRAV